MRARLAASSAGAQRAASAADDLERPSEHSDNAMAEKMAELKRKREATEKAEAEARRSAASAAAVAAGEPLGMGATNRSTGSHIPFHVFDRMRARLATADNRRTAPLLDDSEEPSQIPRSTITLSLI